MMEIPVLSIVTLLPVKETLSPVVREKVKAPELLEEEAPPFGSSNKALKQLQCATAVVLNHHEGGAAAEEMTQIVRRHNLNPSVQIFDDDLNGFSLEKLLNTPEHVAAEHGESIEAICKNSFTPDVAFVR